MYACHYHNPLPTRCFDIRGWGAAFLALTMLALALGVWRGYHAEHAHDLMTPSAFTQVGLEQRAKEGNFG